MVDEGFQVLKLVTGAVVEATLQFCPARRPMLFSLRIREGTRTLVTVEFERFKLLSDKSIDRPGRPPLRSTIWTRLIPF